jgi:acetate kinase
MIVLVINTNRTFLKYQLIKVGTGDVLAKGLCDHIGGTGSTLTHSRRGADSVTSQVDLPDIATAVQSVIKVLTSAKQGVIKNKSAIEAVGHRIVHGGEKFTAPAIITPEIKRAIEAYDHLAPLHNPPSMEGILACEKALPGIPKWQFSTRPSIIRCRKKPPFMPCPMNSTKNMTSANTVSTERPTLMSASGQPICSASRSICSN